MWSENPLEQDELTTLEGEYREALQRLLAAHLEVIERQDALEEVVLRAEALLERVRSE